MEPFLMVANNRLICYYSDERDTAHSQKLVHQTTTDGIHWSSVVNDVALSDSRQRPGMAVVTKMPDGNYIMTYEIIGNPGGAFYKISSDPESWNQADAGTCFDPSGSGPYCVNLNGTILLSSGGNNKLYTNQNNGIGSWTQIDSIIGACYSRCLVPMRNGRLFVIGAGWNGSGLNKVTYGDMSVVTTPDTNVKLVNRATGLCMDGYGNTTNGSDCSQYASNSSNNQKWVLEQSGSNYMIRNTATGLYLDGMARTSNGSVCGQWSNSGSNNQKWLRESTNNFYKFKNVTTGLYLDGMGATANGSNLCQWAASTSYNQQWSVVTT
ncbi:RICIN domain-containing protein [Lacrimispora xylanisolvens]|uniref:RICIN domain-containing protein n=1 Tax=Lacrimispora xylanisolvens TaxID=384636 RepID=UPI002402BF0C